MTVDILSDREREVFKKLQSRGVTPDDYAAIEMNEALQGDIVAVIMKHRVFTPPEAQVRSMLEINEKLWNDPRITEKAIRALGDPPACPASDENGLFCVTLLYETGDTLKTFERNWRACCFVHEDGKTLKWEGLHFSPQGMKSRDGAMVRPKGLRWAVCELGRAFLRFTVRDIRPILDQEDIMGIGAELPAIAAMHPRWATSMNMSSEFPFVIAPDIDVAAFAGNIFVRAPSLAFDREQGIKLHSINSGDRYSYYGHGSLR